MRNYKQDKGVAGLTVLLSLIVMLFVIGLLVMIFAIMGGQMADTDSVKYALSTSATQNSATMPKSSTGLSLTDCLTTGNSVVTAITIINATSNNVVPATNYTVTTCLVTPTGWSIYNGSTVNISYTWKHSGDAYDVMGNTTTELSSVTDWYDIFIVIGAMVVLILLTVIIITAIRGSGMIGGDGNASGNQNINQVGTA